MPSPRLRAVLDRLGPTLGMEAYHALRAEAARHLAVCEGCGSAEGTHLVRDILSASRQRWLCARCYRDYGAAFDALRAEEHFPEDIG